MTNRVRFLCALMALIMTAMLIPSFALAEDARPTITIVTDNFQPVDPDPEGRVMNAIEDIVGYDLQVTWYPLADYATKINTLIAGGTLPEVLMVSEVKGPATVQYVRDGLFWDLTDYLPNYPSLSKINEYQSKSISIDGRSWAVPRDMDMAFNAPVYRSDWLRNLGLEPPTTVDEMYQMFYAFTHSDPDGNGKDDTYGITANSTFAGTPFKMMVVFMGGPNEWLVEDGKAIPYFSTDAFWKSLEFYKKAYSEGVLASNFATMTDHESKEKIEVGVAGGSIAHAWQISERWPNFHKNFPDGDLDVAYILDINGEDRHYPSNGGVSGMYLIPKSSVPDEAALDKVLTYLDRLADPRVQNVIQYGIEGVSYELKEDGTAHIIDQGVYDDEVNVFRRLKPHTMLNVYSPSLEDGAAAKRDAFIKAKADKTVPNPMMPYVSDTYVSRGSDLDQMINDAVVQYVMGALDDAGMKGVIENWYAQGGQQISEEYYALWAADNQA